MGWVPTGSYHGMWRKTSMKIFEKSNFCPKIQFWQNFTIFSGNQSCQQLKSANPQHFHEFFTQIFLTIFVAKSKLSTAKKFKTAAFSRVFTQNNSTIFLGWIFGQKMKISNSVWQKMFLILNIFSFPRYHLVMVS